MLVSSLAFAAIVSSPDQTRAPTWGLDNRTSGRSFTAQYGTVTKPRVEGEGEKSVSVEIRTEVRAFPTGETRVSARMICARECRGSESHQTHEDCDDSCDTACARERNSYNPHSKNDHWVAIPRMYQAYGTDNDDFEAEIGARAWAMLEDAGYSASEGRQRDFESGSHLATGTAMREAVNFTNTTSRPGGRGAAWYATMRFGEEHFNNRPCSSQEAQYGFRKNKLMVRPVVILKAYGVEASEETLYGQEIEYGEFWIPSQIPLAYTEPIVNCKCGGSDTNETAYNEYGGIQLGEQFYPLPNKPLATGNEFANAATAMQLPEGVNLAITGDGGMNTANVSVSFEPGFNLDDFGTDANYEVSLPAGTVLQPNDPEVQNMVVAEGAVFSSSELYAAVGGNALSRDVRVMCLELPKKEPTGHTKFVPLRNQDPALARIAKITEESMFRGPWEQVRLWLYTDHIPFDEIGKRLTPSISAQAYVTLLRELNDAAAMNYSEILKPNIFDKKLLLSVSPDRASTRWFVQILGDTEPKELAKFITDNADGIAQLTKTEEGKLHVLEITESFAAISQDNCRRALPGLLSTIHRIDPNLLSDMSISKLLALCLSGPEDNALEAIATGKSLELEEFARYVEYAKLHHESERVRNACGG